MITAIALSSYFLLGLLVARWTSLRRRKLGLWGNHKGKGTTEEDYIACAFALFGWPIAAAMYFVTAPPREKRLERMKKEVDKLEQELGIK